MKSTVYLLLLLAFSFATNVTNLCPCQDEYITEDSEFPVLGYNAPLNCDCPSFILHNTEEGGKIEIIIQGIINSFADYTHNISLVIEKYSNNEFRPYAEIQYTYGKVVGWNGERRHGEAVRDDFSLPFKFFFNCDRIRLRFSDPSPNLLVSSHFVRNHDCGGVFDTSRTKQKNITNLNFPFYGPQNTTCVWEIQMQTFENISMRSNNFPQESITTFSQEREIEPLVSILGQRFFGNDLTKISVYSPVEDNRYLLELKAIVNPKKICSSLFSPQPELHNGYFSLEYDFLKIEYEWECEWQFYPIDNTRNFTFNPEAELLGPLTISVDNALIAFFENSSQLWPALNYIGSDKISFTYQFNSTSDFGSLMKPLFQRTNTGSTTVLFFNPYPTQSNPFSWRLNVGEKTVAYTFVIHNAEGGYKEQFMEITNYNSYHVYSRDDVDKMLNRELTVGVEVYLALTFHGRKLLFTYNNVSTVAMSEEEMEDDEGTLETDIPKAWRLCAPFDRRIVLEVNNNPNDMTYIISFTPKNDPKGKPIYNISEGEEPINRMTPVIFAGSSDVCITVWVLLLQFGDGWGQFRARYRTVTGYSLNLQVDGSDEAPKAGVFVLDYFCGSQESNEWIPHTSYEKNKYGWRANTAEGFGIEMRLSDYRAGSVQFYSGITSDSEPLKKSYEGDAIVSTANCNRMLLKMTPRRTCASAVVTFKQKNFGLDSSSCPSYSSRDAEQRWIAICIISSVLMGVLLIVWGLAIGQRKRKRATRVRQTLTPEDAAQRARRAELRRVIAELGFTRNGYTTMEHDTSSETPPPAEEPVPPLPSYEDGLLCPVVRPNQRTNQEQGMPLQNMEETRSSETLPDQGNIPLELLNTERDPQDNEPGTAPDEIAVEENSVFSEADELQLIISE